MTNDEALPCKEAVELFTEYLEKVMLPQMRKRFEEHVENRPGCENRLEQVQPSGPDVTFLVFQRLYSRETDHYADPFQMSIAEFSLGTSTIGYLLRNV